MTKTDEDKRVERLTKAFESIAKSLTIIAKSHDTNTKQMMSLTRKLDSYIKPRRKK